MKHYTKEDLELYRNKEMSVLGRLSCSSHLKSCPECSALLAELEEDDKFIRNLKESIEAHQNAK
ncbi:MAG: hypothetical protein J6Q80_05520 [Lentisphaeria bacterium]|nr:hypothetical protein [Lentisphaeria bacterium]